MGKAFLVYLPQDLYTQAKELSQREGPPISFLVREGLRLVLAKRQRKGEQLQEVKYEDRG